jgi:RNA polymerase sigma factor (sigma-70 family)
MFLGGRRVATGQLNLVLQQLRKTVRRQLARGLADGELLERFTRERDEAAFEVLVWRHGPLVLSLCNRLLHNSHDAEDVLQATFLALVKKAGAIGKRDSLGSWLYKVAYRIALRVRETARRRRERAAPVEDLAAGSVPGEEACDQRRLLLEEAIDGLPEHYRTATVLCYLQGKSHKEIAEELARPLGTVSTRLARAREMLRKHLARRGVPLSAGLLSATLAQHAVAAPVGPLLVASTVKAATLVAAGQAAGAGVISARVAALTQGVLKTMFHTQLKTATAALLVGGLLLAGLLLAGPSGAPQAALAQQPAAQAKDKAPDRQQAGKGPGRIKPRATLKGHEGAVQAVAFSPDGKLLASASADQTIKIWNTATGKEVKTLAGHQDVVETLVFSADGKTLASSTGGHFATVAPRGGPDAVKIWDVATWEEKVKLKDSEGAFHSVAFSPDGKELAANGDGSVKLWDTATGKQLRTIKEEGGIYAIFASAFSPDGKTLVLAAGFRQGQEGESIRLWDWAENKAVGTLKMEGLWCFSLAFTLDGKTLVTHNGRDFTFWDYPNSRETKTVKGKGATAFAISPDGKVIAGTRMLGHKKGKFVEYTGNVDLWDAATGETLQVIPMDRGRCVAFSAKGGMLAVGCWGKHKLTAGRVRNPGDPPEAQEHPEGVIRIWDVRDLAVRAKK